MATSSATQPTDRPPRWLWLLPGTIAALRALPWIATYASDPGAGSALLHVGYIPKDLLQYVAFARESAATGAVFVADPFTTEPQDGRFALPLLALVGAVHALAGGALTTWLELARVPLLFAWFAALWRVLALFVAAPRERALACVLVAFSGGLEVLARPLGAALPVEARAELAQATWQMNGWTSFAAAYNPLWLAGGALALSLLALAWRTDGAAARTAAARGAALAAGLPALYLLHPYSAVALGAVLLAHLLVELARGDAARDVRTGLRAPAIAAGAAAGALAVAALAGWQRRDPVFATTAAAALGDQQLSPFWYPLVYGGLCVLALRGARDWVRGAHPLRFALLAWIGAAIWLHTSSLLNGYHFAAQLHVPLCILAAPAFARAWSDARALRPGALALCAATLAAPVLYTAESVVDARDGANRVPAEYAAIADALAARPPGNALTGPRLGNVLPAFTPHRVYVGHHFLTPRYRERSEQVADWTTRDDDAARDALLALVRDARIRYAVLPTGRAAPGIATLAARAVHAQEIGRYTVLELACEACEGNARGEEEARGAGGE